MLTASAKPTRHALRQHETTLILKRYHPVRPNCLYNFCLKNFTNFKHRGGEGRIFHFCSLREVSHARRSGTSPLWKAPDFLDAPALQGWQVVSQTHRPPLPQEKSLVLTFRGCVDLRAHGSVGGTTEKIPSDTGNRDILTRTP